MADPSTAAAELWSLVAAFLGAYLVGSIPFGLLLTRLAGLGDVRRIGSGNIGTTNVLRTGRKELALATLLLDMAKGAGPVLVCVPFGTGPVMAAGAGAVLGHILPVWLRFRGGKGVATALGVLLGVDWVIGALSLTLWVVTALVTRYSSVAALVAIGASPFVALYLGTLSQAWLMAFVAVAVFARHAENLRRLAAGTESKIRLRRMRDTPPS